MRIAALYDLHGNLPAARAVLAEIDRLDVDRIVIGGDVFPGPMAIAILDLLARQPRPCSYLRGNGENDVLAARAGSGLARVPAAYQPPLEQHARDLDAARLAAIAAWPATVRVEHRRLGAVLFCHATPRDDNELFTHRTPVERLAPIFAACGADLVVCGHTHMPFDRQVGNTRVVNAGSLGMPFGERAACWFLLGPDGVEQRRTEYDCRAAAGEIRAAGGPLAEFLAASILEPPSAETMVELFERSALRG